MRGDTVGLKVKGYKSLANCISIIRKYRSGSMGEIKTAVQNDEYVLLFDYDDSDGVKKIISCCKELRRAQVDVQLYEMDDEPTTLKFMENLNDTYDEIDAEVDAEMENEADDDN